MYIADEWNNRIRKVTVSTGIITTIAGSGSTSYAGDNGLATSAALYYPLGVALDLSSNVYIADYLNNRIRKVTVATSTPTFAPTISPSMTPTTVPTTIPTSSKPPTNYPTVTPSTTTPSSYPSLSPSSVFIISTIAGTGASKYSGDGGQATSASIYQPFGVALDESGRSRHLVS